MDDRVHNAGAPDAGHLLGIYLRDHYAGSAAGLALARRCHASNAGTALGSLMAELETEIAEDRRALEALMGRLGVTPSLVKTAAGSIGEVLGRLKSNGRFFRYSPLSRVVELEALAAGIVTKRNLWRALRTVAGRDAVLDRGELDTLIDRATSQYERVIEAHVVAAATAFSSSAATPIGRA